MKGHDKDKWEKATKELDDFLEGADLNRTAIGIRNLILSYLLACDGGFDTWFADLTEELPLLFDLLDTLAVIYPDNDTMDRIGR
jgi:hypothetical protein